VPLGNSYPATQLDDRGEQVDSGVVIQFTDATDQPGTGGSSGSAYLVLVTFTYPSALAGGPVVEIVANSIVGGGSFTGGAGAMRAVVPRLFGAADTVVSGAGVSLETSGTLPPTTDALDLAVDGYVTNQLGTNTASIVVSGSVANPVTDTAKTISLATGTWMILAGADLTDDGGGNLKTTGGGIYSCEFTILVTWD
jgi:hypothetical protein